MSQHQTTVQNPNTFEVGSAKLEIATYAAPADWLDLGAANDVKFTESFTSTQIRAGNIASSIRTLITDQKVGITFSLYEWNFDNLKILREGISTYTDVPGTEVVGAHDTYLANATAAGVFYTFAGRSGDGTVPTTVSVSQDYAGTPVPLVLDTDYVVCKSGASWGVMFIAGGSYDPTDTEQVTYTYTPSASKKLAGKAAASSPAPFMLRATNVNAEDRETVYYFYNTKVNAGFQIELPAESATDMGKLPVELLCEPDAATGDYWYVSTENV